MWEGKLVATTRPLLAYPSLVCSPESCVFALQGGGWAGRLPVVPASHTRLSGGFSALPVIPEREAGVYGVLQAPPDTLPVILASMEGGPATWPKRNVSKRSPTNAVCTICFKDFMYPSALTLHMRTHTGEKPFTCPYPQCDYRSTKKGNLKRHVTTHGEAFMATLEL